MVEDTRARSFGTVAVDYDRFRPGYPAEALRWALAGAGAVADVVDLAAGTGLLTRGLRALGHQVTPVEPDPAMRARLDTAVPGTTALAGSAEAVPLPDASADAVLVGQAYHWFDRERAHVEIARVLRPDGIFAAIWNIRDETVGWVAELGRIAQMGESISDLTVKVTTFGAAFGPVELGRFTHRTTVTADEVLGLMRTRSHWLVAAPQQRQRMDRELRELFATHPDLAGRATVELPYQTLVFRARRR
ncbi:class I SAM-dependent methyltransferase [Micromonospora sp. WMMD730]|uniref:class I SAM-dependent methyltransferase n=1 Tax=Micromonospora sp. WMMD730 TaxID=3404128 RepID=UPI003B960AC9